MNKLLEGKNAVITGARRGMGRAITELFAANGANAWACSHSPSEEFEADMRALSENYGVDINPVYFDLTDQDDIKRGLKEIFLSKREVNILVNNAGITHRALFQMTPVHKAREIFEVDFFAPYFIMQMVVKRMAQNKNGASVINISSTAGLDANSGRAAYGSAKSALACLTRVVAEEVGVHGIRVNAIAPGIIETDMLTYSDEMLKELIDESLLKEIGKPKDVANAALFLASERASFITGQIMRVDGGMLK